MNKFFSWFHHRSEPQSAPKICTTPSEPEVQSFLALPEKNLELTDSVYPPPDAPLRALTADDVLQSQSKLIRELMWAVSMDIADKDRYLLPVIKNLAAFVHLLPASQSHHHNGRGGLFRHSLETAFYAVNVAKNRLMDVNANPADTYHNQSRWFLAIAIAGLMHDVGKCLTDMTITAPTAQKPWLPTVESLSEWLNRNQLQDFYCTWNLNRIHRQHECAGATLYPILVPIETRRYLEESHSTKLKNELFEALVGIRREGGEIAAAVARADMISTKKDIARQLQDGFHPGVNTPIVVWLEKIMQELVENGKWTVNEVDSPLWYTEKGLFLIWHRAVNGIKSRVTAGDFPTMPMDPLVWEDKFKQSSLVESRFLNFEDETSLNIRQTEWRILPLLELEHDTLSSAEDGTTVHLNFLTALKLTENALIFLNRSKPAPVTVFLEGEPLTDEEKKIWLSTTHHPMTVFTSKEELHHLTAPRYSDEEVTNILRSTFAYEDSTEDFVIPDEDGFASKLLPYPDVPMETLLKVNDEVEKKKDEPLPVEREALIEPKRDPNPIKVQLTEDDLLSPSQKAAKAKGTSKEKKTPVHAQDKPPIHTDVYTHTYTDKHTDTDKPTTSENKATPKESTSLSKRVGRRTHELDEFIQAIKSQLQTGSGTFVEDVLYRDDRILTSTLSIEKHLNEKGIALAEFVDKVYGFQSEPILYLTDNRDYVYIKNVRS